MKYICLLYSVENDMNALPCGGAFPVRPIKELRP
jgi:hypothetical protein